MSDFDQRDQHRIVYGSRNHADDGETRYLAHKRVVEQLLEAFGDHGRQR